MYTKESDDLGEDYWAIYDPDGDYVCSVFGEGAADAMLSHLNRQ